MGALASGLCLIHCLATPFIFAAHSGMHGQGHEHGHGHESPFWWSLIDSLLLVVSFLAVLWTARKAGKMWVKVMLFVSWGALFVIIMNEKMSWFHLVEEAIYIPALSLISLHLYNQWFCKCEDDQCKVDSTVSE